MPIGVMNFQPETPQQANPGLNQLSQSLLRQQQMQQNRKNAMLMQFVQPEAQANLLKTQLGNQLTQATLPYAGPTAAANLQQTQLNNKWMDPKMAALIALQKQQTAQAGQETIADQIKNSLLPQSTQADIGLKNAQANFYNQGGKGTASLIADKQFLQQVQADNPNLKPEQLRDAANAYQSGQTTLADGTQLAAPSAETLKWMGTSGKYQTTAPILTKDIQSRQASAELDAMVPDSQADISPYGNTYLGVSPKQISDSLSSSKDSQERLGKFAAGQALQYEIAQQRIKLAQGQPGVTSTQELMDLSLQGIDAKYPKMSAAARKAASDEIQRVLNKGLAARENVGASAALVPQVPGTKNSSPSKNKKWTYDSQGNLVLEGGS